MGGASRVCGARSPRRRGSRHGNVTEPTGFRVGITLKNRPKSCSHRHLQPSARVWRASLPERGADLEKLSPPRPLGADLERWSGGGRTGSPHGSQSVPSGSPHGSQSVPSGSPHGSQSVPSGSPHGRQSVRPRARGGGRGGTPPRGGPGNALWRARLPFLTGVMWNLGTSVSIVDQPAGTGSPCLNGSTANVWARAPAGPNCNPRPPST